MAVAADVHAVDADVADFFGGHGQRVGFQYHQVGALARLQGPFLIFLEGAPGRRGGEHGKGFAHADPLIGVGVQHRRLDAGQGGVGGDRAVRAAADGDARIEDGAVGVDPGETRRTEQSPVGGHVRLADEGRDEGRLHGGHDPRPGHALDLVERGQLEVLDAVAVVAARHRPQGLLHGPQHLLDAAFRFAVHGNLQAFTVGLQNEAVHLRLGVGQRPVVVGIVRVGFEQGGGVGLEGAVGTNAAADARQTQRADLVDLHGLVVTDHADGQPVAVVPDDGRVAGSQIAAVQGMHGGDAPGQGHLPRGFQVADLGGLGNDAGHDRVDIGENAGIAHDARGPLAVPVETGKIRGRVDDGQGR